MSFDLWEPSSGMSDIAFTGHLEFRDIVIPAPGKDEWGVNTLTRTLQGPASKYAKFMAGLQQGQQYKDLNGDIFFLQSWTPIEHKIFPGAQLSYKGLIGDALPNPTHTTTRSETVSSLTVGGLNITIPGEEEDEDRTIVGGTREIKYVTPTTVWRYITRTEPTAPRYGPGVPGSVRGAGIVDRGSVIMAQYEDGASERFVGSAPAALATALSVQPFVDVIGPTVIPIIGTPFCECEETCQLRYPDT